MPAALRSARLTIAIVIGSTVAALRDPDRVQGPLWRASRTFSATREKRCQAKTAAARAFREAACTRRYATPLLWTMRPSTIVSTDRRRLISASGTVK